MSIIPIEYGSLASSDIVNKNFEYLDDRIDTFNNSISSVKSNISTVNINLLQNIENSKEKLNTSIAELKTNIEENIAELKDNTSVSVIGASLAPDYSKGISVSFPYTVSDNGWVFVVADGYDWMHYVYVNNQKVGASCGYSGGKAVRNGVMFMVSKDDVVSGHIAEGMFYPFKGGS